MSKVCKFLKENLEFYDNRIVCCGQGIFSDIENAKKYFIGINVDEYKNDFNIDEYLQKREQYIKMFQDAGEDKKNIPEFCQNCNCFAPIDIDDKLETKNFKFKNINISHKTICNCKCVYCCLSDEGNPEKIEILNKQKSYDIFPILKQLQDKNLIGEETKIGIFGGECTLYPQELNEIISLGEKYNCSFEIYSNGIIYNESIEKLMKNNKICLRISMDCGSKKTFKRIKQIDKFDKVIENLKKYGEAAKHNPEASLQLKYIILPRYNDNIQELKKFFEVALSCRAEQVILSINRFWLIRNQLKPIPISIKRIIKYFVNNNEVNIIRNIDYNELWSWWVEKALKENWFTEVINSIFHIKKRD